MVAGIAIDAWKLPIFREHLQRAGFSFTKHHLTGGTLLLRVSTERVDALAPIVEAAEQACKERKGTS